MAKKKDKKVAPDSLLNRLKRLLRMDSAPSEPKMTLKDVGKEIPSKSDHDSAESANQALENLLNKRN